MRNKADYTLHISEELWNPFITNHVNHTASSHADTETPCVESIHQLIVSTFGPSKLVDMIASIVLYLSTESSSTLYPGLLWLEPRVRVERKCCLTEPTARPRCPGFTRAI